MTPEQFEVVAHLIRSREPATSAARRVLLDGLSQADAAREFGLGPNNVWNTVNRFRKADEALREVYGG